MFIPTISAEKIARTHNADIACGRTRTRTITCCVPAWDAGVREKILSYVCACECLPGSLSPGASGRWNHPVLYTLIRLLCFSQLIVRDLLTREGTDLILIQPTLQ